MKSMHENDVLILVSVKMHEIQIKIIFSNKMLLSFWIYLHVFFFHYDIVFNSNYVHTKHRKWQQIKDSDCYFTSFKKILHVQ